MKSIEIEVVTAYKIVKSSSPDWIFQRLMSVSTNAAIAKNWINLKKHGNEVSVSFAGCFFNKGACKTFMTSSAMNLIAKCVKSSTKGKLVDGENEGANLKNHPTSPRNAVTKQQNTTPCPVLWFTWRHVVFWFQISCMPNLMQKRRAFVKCDNILARPTLCNRAQNFCESISSPNIYLLKSADIKKERSDKKQKPH